MQQQTALDIPTTERNLRFLILEIVWAAVFIGCASFNAAYLIRLGGSNFLVSLLTAGGALVNALTALPFAGLMERRSRRRPWIIGSLAVYRLAHLGLIAIPWFPGPWQPEAMVLLIIVLNVPLALFVAGWLPMLADVIPIQRQARIFATRNMVLGATTAGTTFLLGSWLERAPFPFNYQLLYALGVVASCLSTGYVARLVIPESPVEPRTRRQRLGMAHMRALLAEQRPFANLVGNTLIFNLAFWMAVPLQPIYFVRVLGASDAWLGLWIGLVSAGTILGNLFWQRVIDRRGASWVLLRSTALSALYYFLIGAFPNLQLILLFALLAGLVNPGVEVSHLSILLRICPQARRATYLGVFVTVMNLGFFVAPLLVAPLAELLGVRQLVLLLGVLRLFGAMLFTLNPVAWQAELASRA